MRTSFITDKKEIESIIELCDICFVGIVEEDGMPYVIPMNFGYADNQIILHSGPDGKHLELLEKDNRICVTFCSDRTLKFQHPDVACSYSMESKSVVCQGTVSFLNDDDLAGKERAMNILMKNYTDNPFKYSAPALRNVKVWLVDIQNMTAKSFGQHYR